MAQRIVVTGGAGFIGSALTRYLIGQTSTRVLVVDKMTYAANPAALGEIEKDPRYAFVRADISDFETIKEVMLSFRPDAVMNLAAESHVDRSIEGPGEFIQTNVVGTFSMLQAALGYWHSLSADMKEKFRFHHISTDEVFGSLGDSGHFHESTPYDPSSPYSASKAASDHLVRAWYRTFGLPVIITNCSNNYGPWQFPEKLIPLMITNGLEGKLLPVYGRGLNIRDWLHVDDHAKALWAALRFGRSGECYCIGGSQERRNIDVVKAICTLLDEMSPKSYSHHGLIRYVTDRPGHDQRYAIESSKAQRELNWKAEETFETGLRKTVIWYLRHRHWWQSIGGVAEEVDQTRTVAAE